MANNISSERNESNRFWTECIPLESIQWSTWWNTCQRAHFFTLSHRLNIFKCVFFSVKKVLFTYLLTQFNVTHVVFISVTILMDYSSIDVEANSIIRLHHQRKPTIWAHYTVVYSGVCNANHSCLVWQKNGEFIFQFYVNNMSRPVESTA